VTGERRIEQESSDGPCRIVRCVHRPFRQDLILPFEVDVNCSQVRYGDGVLYIDLQGLPEQQVCPAKKEQRSFGTAQHCPASPLGEATTCTTSFEKERSMSHALLHKPHHPEKDVPDEFEPGAPPVEPDEGPVPDFVPDVPEHEPMPVQGAIRESEPV
jgi:hypothetical protein